MNPLLPPIAAESTASNPAKDVVANANEQIAQFEDSINGEDFSNVLIKKLLASLFPEGESTRESSDSKRRLNNPTENQKD